MNEIRELLGLGKEYNVIKTEEEKRKGKINKLIYVETKQKRIKCPECKKYTNSIHDRLKESRIKYLKTAEYETYIVIRKKRFICHRCDKKITEKIDIVNDNKNISNKLEQKILKDLLDYNLSIKYISQKNNISEAKVRDMLVTVMEGSTNYVRNLPRVISLDEFKADTDKGKYAMVLNDIIHRKVLDILPSRKKEYLLQYFTNTENRHSVEYVVSDMYEPYLIVTRIMFPKAKYVVDRFHYIRYIMEALDNVRIRLQKSNGYNSKIYRMLKNKKNVSLLRRYSNDVNWWSYTKRYRNNKIIEILNFDLREELLSIDEELRRGYQLKEMFLDIVNRSSYEESKRELMAWIDLCRESEIEEFVEASNTIENWLEYICNSFIDKRFSNGFTEGMNNKIKVIKRVAFGYRNFEFYRLRLLYILNGKIRGKTKK